MKPRVVIQNRKVERAYGIRNSVCRFLLFRKNHDKLVFNPVHVERETFTQSQINDNSSWLW